MKEFSRADFNAKLKAARKYKRLTQFDLSEMLGIKRNTYARYETDSYPSVPTLYRICKILGVSPDYLMNPEKQIIDYSAKKKTKTAKKESD